MARRFARLAAVALVLAVGLPAVAATSPALDDEDAWMIEDSAQESLENTRTNQTTVWQNPDTGNSGTFTPIETFQNDDGQHCREYHQTVTIGGEEQEAYGTACRKEDGTWEITRSDPPDAIDDPPTVVYRDRVVYVPAPRPIYRYPVLYPFALSIGFAFWDGHRHFGHFYFGHGTKYYTGGRVIRYGPGYHRHGGAYWRTRHATHHYLSHRRAHYHRGTHLGVSHRRSHWRHRVHRARIGW